MPEFRQYVKELKRLPKLSNEEKQDLVVKYKQGEVDRNVVIEAFLYLPFSIVIKHFRNNYCEDLLQDANLLLYDLIDKYDETRSVPFHSYVTTHLIYILIRKFHKYNNGHTEENLPACGYLDEDTLYSHYIEPDSATVCSNIWKITIDTINRMVKPKYRKVVKEYLLGSAKEEELAKEIGCTKQYISQLVQPVRRRLKELL